jgi:glycosyltransferase involved in cell wall biosynthesis
VTVLTTAPNFPEGKLFAGYENHWYRREWRDDIEIVRVKSFIAKNEGVVRRTLDFLSYMVTAYVAGLIAKRPDIVIATSPQFFTAVGGWALAATRRLPFIFELGDLWPRSIVAVGALQAGQAVRLLEWIELFLYRRAARVVALTQAFKDDLVRRGIPAGTIAVIRNGVDLPRYAPRPRDQALAAEWGLSGKFVIGYVGTHGMAHDLGKVLDAAEGLRESEPELRFLLVGAGAERDQLVAAARQRNLDNVVLQPLQPKERMAAVWSLCNVALIHLKNMPAFAEVIPSKMFEAMGMGLPMMLAAPKGEASRLLADDGAGLWVPAGDAAALAAACRRLMTDVTLRDSLAARSLKAAPRHSREQQAKLFIDVIDQVVGNR